MKHLVVYTDSLYERALRVSRRLVVWREPQQGDGSVEQPIYLLFHTRVIMHHVDFCRLLSFSATLYSQRLNRL